MNTFLVSVPYVYPLCPLNFNHAKMFVVADVFARFNFEFRDNKDYQIIFPVASHFSGNTAQSTAFIIKDFLEGCRTDICIKTFDLYRKGYKVPVNIIRRFIDPHFLMSFFNEEILWELKSLSVSCNYEDAYTTNETYFEAFVKAIFHRYADLGLFVKNDVNHLAINYSDTKWREETIELINKTDIRQAFHRSNILSAFKNLSKDWDCLRKTGYGVKYLYEGEEWFIDPMFDSELFMVFDLFIHWKNKLNVELDDADFFFDCLLKSLSTNCYASQPLLNENERCLLCHIIDSLPCAVFIAEEHLKNWIGKKFFAEQKLLHPQFRTSSYRILGMALLDGKRMSASKGHAILSRDLIKEYGGTITRLVLLMSGGNISKTYNYEKGLPEVSKKMLDNFSDYLVFLKSDFKGGTQEIEIRYYSEQINSYIKDGYFRQAIIVLLSIIPSMFKNPSSRSKMVLLAFYKQYLQILIPDYAERYC